MHLSAAGNWKFEGDDCQDWTKFYLCRKAVFLVISEAKNQLVELILVVQPNPSSPELEKQFLVFGHGSSSKAPRNRWEERTQHEEHLKRNTCQRWMSTWKRSVAVRNSLDFFMNLQVWASENLGTSGPSIGTVNPIIWSSFSWKCCPRNLQPKLVTTQLPPSVSICEPPQTLIDNWS